MHHRSKALALGLLLSLAGCPAGEGEGEGTSEAGATDDTAGDPTDGGLVAACGLPMPCQGYNALCRFGDDFSGCGDEPYPEPLVCMLEVLAAGEPAQLYVSVGEIEEWLDIGVYGPDAAIYQRGTEGADYVVFYGPAQQCTPKPAEWFEACLADTGDAAQHIACMDPSEWLEGCSQATACL